ncbi:MAG: cyclic pyranopterin monophosphate synthase MoaC [Clostridia bacterium]|nr:cyclic pyranopterin monophosphate synthase MoaC [Clostridia bacterium]
MSSLTHFDETGRARMVNVGGKHDTQRVAVAEGEILMKPETIQLIKSGEIAKGDVLAVAQVAGIMAAKETNRLIPMCHPLLLEGVKMSFEIEEVNNRVIARAEISLTGKTGVEMEAMTGVSIALLTIYDMCKAVDKEMTITGIKLTKKTGGKSGTFIRGGDK